MISDPPRRAVSVFSISQARTMAKCVSQVNEIFHIANEDDMDHPWDRQQGGYSRSTTRPDMSIFRLDSEGYFLRDGKRFWPVGCNYTSSSCGAMIWKSWPEAEIRADLAGMQRLGFNSLRFFVHWEDVEPEPGRYDPLMEKRLQQFCQWCAEFGIHAHPSLFVGWM